MPAIVPNSYGAHLREYNLCHDPKTGKFADMDTGACVGNPKYAPGAYDAKGHVESKGKPGSGEMPSTKGLRPAHAAAVREEFLSHASEVARRMNEQPTQAELADPRFGAKLDSVRQSAESGGWAAQHPVPYARALHEQALAAEVVAGKDSQALYRRADGSWAPERKKVHDAIIRDYITRFTKPVAGRNPQVIVTGGISGGGKTTGLKATGVDGKLMSINSDDIKSMLPEFNGANAAFLHEESDHVMNRLLNIARNSKQDFIIDITMKSPGVDTPDVTQGTSGRIRSMAKAGYDVHVQFTSIDVEDAPVTRVEGGKTVQKTMPGAVSRVMDRYRSKGRFVSPAFVRAAKGKTLATKNEETFQQVLGAMGDAITSAVRIDNRVFKGEKATVTQVKGKPLNPAIFK